MDERVSAAFQLLPEYLGSHVILSAASLALGIAVSLPLVVAASRYPRVRWPLVTFSNVIQTVPSLALLALFYPLLLALSSVTEQFFGARISALGFLPSLLALTLYSMLPVVRNGVTGLMNLDPAVLEAARGVGMTPRQMLMRIELPLAAPVLMAGVRTSAVWVIGTATLSTPVGQTSLGNYIFSGLQVQNWVFVSFGCVAAAALALIADCLLGLIEKGVAKRRPGLIWAGLVLLLAGIAAACVPLVRGEPQAYVIGAKNFTEQYILSRLMADRLREAGHPVSRRIGLGSSIAFQAVSRGDIDAYVEYSGTVWANLMGRTDRRSRQEMLVAIRDWMREKHGVGLLGPLGFENAYALAMRRDRAEALGVRSIADLARHARSLSFGSDLEFTTRPEWKALQRAYGLQFRGQKQFQPTFMYRALQSREVDVISAFSSDGRIAAYDLVVLDDPRQAILPYDAIVLVAPARVADAALRRALAPLVHVIPIRLMREANWMVDRDRDPASPEQAARWLATAAHLTRREE